MHGIKHSVFTLALLAAIATPAFATTGTEVAALLTKAKTMIPADAAKVAAQVLKLDPNNGDAHALLAWDKFVNDDRDGCIAECKKAIELKPTMPFYKRTAYNYMYHAYLQKKDWKQALEYCIETYKLEKTLGVTNDLANLYKLNGDMAKAQEYSLKAGELRKEGLVSLKTQMTEFKDAHDPKRCGKVLEEANKKLDIDPNDEHALALRAQCYTTKKEYAKALDDLNKAIAIDPNRGYYYAHRAKVYKGMGDSKKAAENVAEAKAHGFDEEKVLKMVEAQKASQKASEKAGQKTGPKSTAGGGAEHPAVRPD